MALEVRPAREADLASLAAIEKACFPDPWGEIALRGQLAAQTGLSLAAELDGQVIGSLFLSFIPPEGEVYRVAVLPAARRMGVGDALITAGLAAAREAGVRHMFLDVREGNIPAQNLYKKHGFTVIGHRARYYRAPTEDAVLMKRGEMA